MTTSTWRIQQRHRAASTPARPKLFSMSFMDAIHGVADQRPHHVLVDRTVRLFSMLIAQMLNRPRLVNATLRVRNNSNSPSRHNLLASSLLVIHKSSPWVNVLYSNIMPGQTNPPLPQPTSAHAVPDTTA